MGVWIEYCIISECIVSLSNIKRMKNDTESLHTYYHNSIFKVRARSMSTTIESRISSWWRCCGTHDVVRTHCRTWKESWKELRHRFSLMLGPPPRLDPYQFLCRNRTHVVEDFSTGEGNPLEIRDSIGLSLHNKPTTKSTHKHNARHAKDSLLVRRHHPTVLFSSQ